MDPTPARDGHVHLAGVAKRYTIGEVEVAALEGVDLDVEPGSFVVILGPSGSGKTTLLNLVGALDSPTTGQVAIGGRDISRADRSERFEIRRHSVSFVFQSFNLFPGLTAVENVAFGAEVAGCEDPWGLAEDVLGRVGLGERLDHFPHQMSGGEQQRVAIARALCKNPELLLCDEPTGALDYPTGKLVLEVIARISQELGTTVVVITHNAAIAAMADRVLHLGDGRIQREERNARRADPSELSW